MIPPPGGTLAIFIETMIKILRTYLCEEVLNKTVSDVSDTEDLLVSGLVDSIGMMRFVRFIEERFSVKVPPEDLVLENFSSLRAITDYLGGRVPTDRI